MGKTGKPLLDVLRGRIPERIPFWLMRQAGRYLPEYRALRAEAGSFLTLCLTPDLATEITLQPLRRFGMDAAIIFADILLLPMAMGLDLHFREGEGPVLQKVASLPDLDRLVYDSSGTDPVMRALRQVKPQLSPATALIGFCGAPWTMACYMIDGTSKTGFSAARKCVYDQPEFIEKLIGKLVDASVDYLSAQIEAGAEVVQLFDSWAGLLTGEAFAQLVVAPTRDLVARLRQKHPTIPVIGFPRQAAAGYEIYVRQTGIDALSIDTGVELSNAKRVLQSIKPLQGNLDPALLVKGGTAMTEGATEILRTLGPLHIFNLGHGVLPETPPEHVAELAACIREFRPQAGP